MNSSLTSDVALSIAQEYKNKFELSGDISDNLECAIKFYNEFDSINGSVWLVTVSIEPNDFFAENEYTIVISDKEATVKYIIDPNGHVYCPHLETMTE
ncbi:hypothetical protein M2444_005689 [Paenibacillus sp. PastF-3]|uniref:hypothetical protein n=1 Tax=Paenibacillus sp. PastF-3 TaxID=2940626 RepID=UPI0024741574|nr:hypothetical protein [Paenibacillus sp. PastF-3]MDH6373846.1 hypothetical protein [Paenibacillus sp. PastF-3]